MSKLAVYGIIALVCKLALYASILVMAFLVSTPLAVFIIAATAIGLASDELRYREQVKLQQQAAGELMQAFASKTGQGSC